MKRQDEIQCSKSLTLPSGSTFTLSSIVNHIGPSPSDGHYNVLLYDHLNDGFVLVDDLNISYIMNINSDIKKLCYIAIYTKDA